ncbi:nitrile hydratase subunit beta [Phenylobacterium sp.]|uniref:nitrile hydratase subunit beta n=1 Tax=Phenylobacterium sp. TaxID=1871053 RepID=UPI0025E91D7B|nr:nitrile hydratase subunit beta [Phenylobacterium sp.]MCA3721940.1 nitrile hydratase subunit beta [Phenylobacterium sp.]
MNGVHDLGGRHGMGHIEAPPAEPVFHEDWERRVFAMHILLSGAGYANVDEFRHAIERMPAADYLQTTYYEHWLYAIESGCLQGRLLSETEVLTGKRDPGAPPPSRSAFPAKHVEAMVFGGGTYRKKIGQPPRFEPGMRIRARNIHPTGHTRLPLYVRGRVGHIVQHHGSFIFPDSNAHGRGHDPQHMYGVAFTAEALWGESAPNPRDTIRLDLWEPYIELAEG